MQKPIDVTKSELVRYCNFLLNKVGKGKMPIIIKHFGKPKAVLLSVDTYNELIKQSGSLEELGKLYDS